MSSMADLVHQALFYDSPEQLMATLAPFIMKALRRRHAILAVTTSDNIRAIESGLGGDAEEVEFVESSDWYHTPGQTLAAYHRYVQDQRGGHDRVWLIGELAWQDRDTAETDEWIRYDSAYNLAFAGLPASIICLFDQTRLPPAIIADARRTHPLVTTPYGSSPTSEYADPARFWNERTTALAPAPLNAPSLRFGTDPRPVRAFVARHVAWWGLSPERIDDLVIAVNEVTTNAVSGSPGSSPTPWTSATAATVRRYGCTSTSTDYPLRTSHSQTSSTCWPGPTSWSTIARRPSPPAPSGMTSVVARHRRSSSRTSCRWASSTITAPSRPAPSPSSWAVWLYPGPKMACRSARFGSGARKYPPTILNSRRVAVDQRIASA